MGENKEQRVHSPFYFTLKKKKKCSYKNQYKKSLPLKFIECAILKEGMNNKFV